MTETAPSSTAPPGPRRLSPAGRERFGERLAGQLWLTAGGLAALIVTPALLGAADLKPVGIAAAAISAVALAVMATVVHYLSVERATEVPSRSRSNG